MHIVGRAVLILLLPILCVLALLAGLLQRPVARSRADVATLLERRADDEVDDDAWDDFLCIPVADPVLESIRRTILTWEESGDPDPAVLRDHARDLQRTPFS